jgi:hypothetical protein
MKNLIQAVLEVMKEVKSIEKNLEVGKGTYSSYKGVADKDVKLQIGQAMQKNGLIILPISVEPKTTVTEWEDQNQKHKTQVLTEVVTRYKLMHTSGESIDLAGYGHGVDSQDKSAGKATTYALKYALLNTFLVPTGDIDDADSTHSDSYAQPPKTAEKKVLQPVTTVDDIYNELGIN